MANSVYNTNDIETAINNAGTISTNITSLTDAISTEIGGLDIRVFNYFDCFSNAKNSNSTLSSEVTTVDAFKDWMNETYTDFSTTKANVEGSSGTGTQDLSFADANATFPSINVDPNKVTPYDLTSAAWEALPTEDKKAIEAKLKELGFTDDEIQAIKDGNASVNKVTLDKLDSALEKLNSEGSDVRSVILKQYGFDVFNDDGTINRDKLALALLIDNKDPNDEYDLVKLLKTKYGIDLFPEGATGTGLGSGVGNVSPSLPTTDDNKKGNGSDVSDIHTGLGYGSGTSGSGDGTDTSEIDAMLNGDEDKSLLDGLQNLSGSLLNRKDGIGIGFNGKDGGGAAGVAGVAGIAGLGAAATAAGLLASKRKKDAILDDDDFDDDEFDDDDDDEDDDDDNLNDELDDDNNDENNDIDDDDLTSKNKKKKDWLYGLGIGLAGTGLIAGVLGKDDDEEEEEDNNNNNDNKQ